MLPSARMRPGSQVAIAVWGVASVSVLLGQAVYRLTPLALEPWAAGMSPPQELLYIGWLVLNMYLEGYRGFQLRFCPRVVARAMHLGQSPTVLRVILALPFCMGLMHATRRRLIGSWTFLVVLICLIVGVRMLPQPWRGIVDGGVVIGLVWGLIALWLIFARQLAGTGPLLEAELPEIVS